ncbi:MAG TPA: hypothetical protein PLP27_08255 [Crocinitomicaceae bacterium]|nr:hypothetical protein [Crocinitomicaceae bacterium]
MKEKENSVSIGTVTKHVPQEVIDALKAKYPDLTANNELKRLYLPTNDLGTEELEVIVRVPDRNTVTQFMRFVESQPKKAQELLVNQCLLTSKEEVMNDDYLFFTCTGSIAELFPIRQGRLKNF